MAADPPVKTGWAGGTTWRKIYLQLPCRSKRSQAIAYANMATVDRD